MAVCPFPIERQITVFDMVNQPLDALDHPRFVNTDVLRIPVSFRVFAKDITTKRSKEWIQVIGGAGDSHDVIYFALLLQRLSDRSDLVPSLGRCLDEVSVVKEAKILGGVGQAIQNSVEGAGF